MAYPEYVNGEPPIVGLREYDLADWNASTSVDQRDGGYVVVETQNPDKVIAKLDPKDELILDQIFKVAHEEYYEQVKTGNVQKK